MTYNVFGGTLNLAQLNSPSGPAIVGWCIYRSRDESWKQLEGRVAQVTMQY